MIGISLRTVERWRNQAIGDDGRSEAKSKPANALSGAETARILRVMTSEEYWHLSPKQLVPRLADQGLYLASESTLYRLKRRLGLSKTKRQSSRKQVSRSTTVHRANGPNQVWSWDITYLPTTTHGKFLYLYLIMDIWSRRIVGARVFAKESAEHAATLFYETCSAAGIDPRGLILHSDNGHPMRGSTMLSTLQWLGVMPSFSRPHVSNDNPYSESLFHTLKYSHAYPQHPFSNASEANAWVESFVRWYNETHRHSSIRYVTPNQRHFGEDTALLAERILVYEKARKKHPNRWTGASRNWTPIAEVSLDPHAGLRKLETKNEQASATRLAGASRWQGSGTENQNTRQLA